MVYILGGFGEGNSFDEVVVFVRVVIFGSVLVDNLEVFIIVEGSKVGVFFGVFGVFDLDGIVIFGLEILSFELEVGVIGVIVFFIWV